MLAIDKTDNVLYSIGGGKDWQIWRIDLNLPISPITVLLSM